MKKIGIITINDTANYGNRLQNYALYSYLKRFGYDVFTIIVHDSKQKMILRKLRHVLGNAFKLLLFNKYSKYNNFSKFQNKIKFKNVIKTNLNDFDFLIVGSDQVWNPSFSRLSDIDILKNVDNNKRISYAASFGISDLDEASKEKVKNEISKFKAISVRENIGKELIEKITDRKDVEVLIDPTMLLTADEWDRVSTKPKKLKSSKYILNYFLGNLSSERKIEIERIAIENNCDIINILDKNDPLYDSGPSEFLYLEKHAFLICTDSFHSSVFAIIYDIPFIIFDRDQEGMRNMNSRIETLLSKFKIDNRNFNGKRINKENINHDYTKAYKILELERKKSIIFLNKALDIK